MTRANDPIMINSTKVKNRITMAPTVKFDYAGPDGLVTEKHIEHYGKRAEHGCGLICVEATAVTPGGRFAKNHLGLWDDAQIDGHRMINEACHKYGCVMLIQLNHTGITANPECGPAIGPSSAKTATKNTRATPPTSFSVVPYTRSASSPSLLEKRKSVVSMPKVSSASNGAV